MLIAADLGTEVARRVIASFRRTRFGKEVTDEEIKQALAEEIAGDPGAGGAAAACSIRRRSRMSCWWSA